ncbi:ATP-binding protein [Streptomyces sp. HUAS TT20]|uniref:ATP-binding protein n=1 Tax=Streptomyces sp. HUAS TT20 TaxID=3447509 RepID=UPI0021D8526B|nr:ATP-binding protein [Streptomyces sp. HUAS 15-9]UXY33014.1 ATP-binding protein [Streptomyces sp. HUAS 15-9]
MTAARAAGTDVPSYTETWPCEEKSAPKARQLVSAALSLWGIGPSDAADDVHVVASELVANAITHSGCASFRIRVSRLDRTTVQVLVTDTSRKEPTLRPAGADAETGRGLRLVDVLSLKWGCEPQRWGKKVWAELRVPGGPECRQES